VDDIDLRMHIVDLKSKSRIAQSKLKTIAISNKCLSSLRPFFTTINGHLGEVTIMGKNSNGFSVQFVVTTCYPYREVRSCVTEHNLSIRSRTVKKVGQTQYDTYKMRVTLSPSEFNSDEYKYINKIINDITRFEETIELYELGL